MTAGCQVSMQPIKNGRDVRVEPKVIEALAQEYAVAVHSAASMGVAAEPEAQLTNPVDNFLTRFAAEAGLGELTLIREAQLDGVRRTSPPRSTRDHAAGSS